MNITSKIITISQARNIKLKLNIVFYLFSFLFLIIIIYLFNSIYTTDTTKKEDLNKLSINTENNNNCEYISNSSQGKVNDSIFKDGYIGITIFIMFALMALYILLRFESNNVSFTKCIFLNKSFAKIARRHHKPRARFTLAVK